MFICCSWFYYYWIARHMRSLYPNTEIYPSACWVSLHIFRDNDAGHGHAGPHGHRENSRWAPQSMLETGLLCKPKFYFSMHLCYKKLIHKHPNTRHPNEFGHIHLEYSWAFFCCSTPQMQALYLEDHVLDPIGRILSNLFSVVHIVLFFPSQCYLDKCMDVMVTVGEWLVENA